MIGKDKFLYVFLIVITFGLIKIHWNRKTQKPKDELTISFKINLDIDLLIKYLGSIENIESVDASNSILKIKIKDNDKIQIEKLKQLKEVSGIVNNSKMVSMIVGKSAKTIKERIENLL